MAVRLDRFTSEEKNVVESKTRRLAAFYLEIVIAAKNTKKGADVTFFG
jgi:hypothetical protein